MLSLHRVSVEMALSYFENDDYYSKDDPDNKPKYFGKNAENLGLLGNINDQTFSHLLHGYHPDGKKKLVSSKQVSLRSSDLAKSISSLKKKYNQSSLNEKQKDYLTQKLTEFLKIKPEEWKKIWEISDKKNSKEDVEKIIDGKELFHFDYNQKRELSAIFKAFVSKIKLPPGEKKTVSRVLSRLVMDLGKSGHHAGLDATFSAPKSVSLGHFIKGDQRLLSAHKEAVDYALSHLEDRCAQVRGGFTASKKRIFEKTGNIIGAQFQHGSSRAKDPQLHTHCVIFNMSKNLKGEWRAFSNEEIFKQSKLLGCIYQNKLAELCQKIGYEIELKKSGTFELSGYSDEHLELFSKRRSQVLDNSAKIIYEKQLGDALKDYGFEYSVISKNKERLFMVVGSKAELVKKGFSVSEYKGQNCYINGFIDRTFVSIKDEIIDKKVTQKVNRYGVLRDRELKQNISSQQLKSNWLEEAKINGVEHPKANGTKFLWGKSVDTNYGVSHLGERKAVFSKYELELHSLMGNLGKTTFEEIETKLKNNPKLLNLEWKETEKKASLNQLNAEKSIINIAQKGFNKFKSIGSIDLVDNVANIRGYTNGQREALAVSLTSKDQFQIWHGVAGSGKSYALNDLVDIAKNDGYKVYGLSPDASSAKVLAQSIEEKTSTVDSFLLKTSNGYTDNQDKKLFIIDEAGKLSTQKALSLMSLAERDQARMIFVGDTRQFSSIEAGNPFKSLFNTVEKAELTEHKRQEDKRLKTAVELASMGGSAQIKASVGVLKPDLIERKTQGSRQNHFMSQYLVLKPEERDKTLLICDRNVDRFDLIQKLRDSLKEEGSLSKNEFNFPILRDISLTKTQSLQARNYSKKDIIIFSNDDNARGIKSNIHYEVVGIKGESLTIKSPEAKKYEILLSAKNIPSIFKKELISVSKGDVLEWRRNHEGRINREKVTVTHIEKDGEVVLKNLEGKEYKVSKKDRHHLDYGLVSTTYSSQGETKNRVIALMDSSSSKQSWYVAISRAKQKVDIITDDIKKLTNRVIVNKQQENVLDYNVEKIKTTVQIQNEL